jgi:hypothetical protein
MEEIKTYAVQFAKEIGHSVENLKTMHAPNTINPFVSFPTIIS